MKKLSNKQIKYLDMTIRVNAIDMTENISKIKISNYFIVGSEDYVDLPIVKNKYIINTGHCSPIENPELVFQFIKKVLI